MTALIKISIHIKLGSFFICSESSDGLPGKAGRQGAGRFVVWPWAEKAKQFNLSFSEKPIESGGQGIVETSFDKSLMAHPQGWTDGRTCRADDDDKPRWG